MPVGSEVEVRLSLPDARRMTLTVRIEHVITPDRALADGVLPGMGLSFLELAPDEEQALGDRGDELGRRREHRIGPRLPEFAAPFQVCFSARNGAKIRRYGFLDTEGQRP